MRQPLTRRPSSITQPLQLDPLPPLLTPIYLIHHRRNHVWHASDIVYPFAAQDRGELGRDKFVKEDEGHPEGGGEEEEGLVREDVEEGDDLR
jgi:hypothetical protein